MNPTTHERRPAPPTAWPPPRRAPRSRARLVWVALAFFALVAAGGMAATAGVVDHFDDQRRDGDYLTTDRTRVTSQGHAVVFDEIDLDGLDGDWLLGTARLRATSTRPDSPVFIGVALSSDVATYLRGAGYSTIDEFDDGDVTYVEHAGGPPAIAPADSDIWTAQAGGTGTQTVTWKPEDGSWTVVIMNYDGSSGVDVQADAGATVPILRRAVHWLIAASVVSGAAGVLVLVLVVMGSRRRWVSQP
jgi:hypothetical protein